MDPRTTRPAASLLALALAAHGCATAAPPGRRASAYVYATERDPVSGRAVNIGQVDMPLGESFTGSYHSQQLGDLYLEQVNTAVTGTYEYDRAACHATGRIEGRAAGNLLRFSWTESQAACGRLTPLTGHGYLLFWQDRGTNGVVNGRLDGEWGFGEAEMGSGHWSAFRDAVRRQPPRPRDAGAQNAVFRDGAGAPPAAQPAAP